MSFKSDELFRFGHTESIIWIGISITAALMHVLVFIYSKGDDGIFFSKVVWRKLRWIYWSITIFQCRFLRYQKQRFYNIGREIWNFFVVLGCQHHVTYFGLVVGGFVINLIWIKPIQAVSAIQRPQEMDICRMIL